MGYFEIPADSCQPILHQEGAPQGLGHCVEDGELTWFQQGSGIVNYRLSLLATRLGADCQIRGNGAIYFTPGTRDEGFLLRALARWLGFTG